MSLTPNTSTTPRPTLLAETRLGTCYRMRIDSLVKLIHAYDHEGTVFTAAVNVVRRGLGWSSGAELQRAYGRCRVSGLHVVVMAGGRHARSIGELFRRRNVVRHRATRHSPALRSRRAQI
jgi:hypothetical protein